MFRFFRQIRQKLLLSGSTQKYLLYAIGEIFLVVIGILIALQFNNWNVEKGNKAKLETYLIALKKETQSNVKVVSQLKRRVIGDIRKTIFAMEQLTGDSAKYIDNEKLKELDIGPFPTERLQRSVYNDVINSGVLAFLEDSSSLKEKIFKTGVELEDHETDGETSREIWGSILRPYLKEHFDILGLWDSMYVYDLPVSPFQSNLDAFVLNKEYINILTIRLRNATSIENQFGVRMNRFEDLVEEIDHFLGDN